MDRFLIDMLECPLCHQPLDWQIDHQFENQIEQAEARCSGCEATFPVREGIGIFLTPELPRNDLWEQVDSQLTSYLRDHPDIERTLMESALEELSPTDQHFRVMLLEEQEYFAEARDTENIANKNLYTTAYIDCWNRQYEYVLDMLATMTEPVVDLASGRGYLVEKITTQLNRPVVATDFSLSVLQRDRKLFQFLGINSQVSLLAYDARLTPFKDRAVAIMTTNLGLPNIEEPDTLLHELNRIVDGTLLAISHFFPDNDEVHKNILLDAGLEKMLYHQSTIDQFVQAGWNVVPKNTCIAEALPTPESRLIEGASADGLPVAPTELEWCVLHATKA